jgi:hypothetical protein
MQDENKFNNLHKKLYKRRKDVVTGAMALDYHWKI